MRTQTTLASGRTLVLNLVPFAVGMKLFKTIANELKSADIDLASLKMKDIADADVNGIKNAVLQLAGSDALQGVIFECFARSTIDGARIVPDSFEALEHRADYFPAAWEVMKFNLTPFFAGIDWKSLTKGPQTSDAPAPASNSIPKR